MEKNKSLRTASGLFILVLLTTCVIGATFAKYTTTGSASDTARVAKWGVTITASGSLYSDAYVANAEGGNKDLPATWTAASPSASTISVAAATRNDNIVAPGTKNEGEGLGFGISGTPEVAVNVKTTIAAEDIFLASGTYGVLVPATIDDDVSLKKTMAANGNKVYKVDSGSYTKVASNSTYTAGGVYYVLTDEVTVNSGYFPVIYTLTEGTTANNAHTAVGIADVLAKKVENSATNKETSNVFKASYESSQDFSANTNLGTAGPMLGGEKLTWKWEIEKGDDDTAKKNNNAADTILGDLIAARGVDSPGYVVVAVDATSDDAVTKLTYSTDDYTVKKGNDVVANLRTKFDIKLEVTQVD